MHAHSLNLDGDRTFEAMIGRMSDAGFDFVVSTEHNSPNAHFRFPEASKAHPNVLLLYGEELTSPGSHAGIIGQPAGRWFDFRMDPGDGKLPALIANIHKDGALFSVNHPYAPCTSCIWKYPESEWAISANPQERADAIEVWNGAWTPDDRLATDLWDRLLKAGRQISAFGGTDYHRGSDPLSPAVFVHAENLSLAAIQDGLRHGRDFLSSGPKGPRVYLTAASAPQSLPGDRSSLTGTQTTSTSRRESSAAAAARSVSSGKAAKRVSPSATARTTCFDTTSQFRQAKMPRMCGGSLCELKEASRGCRR